MLEQAAAAIVHQPAPTAGIVVSVTLSAGAILTAIGTLFKVARWMGHTEERANGGANRAIG